MATFIPRQATGLEALGQAFQLGLPGMVQGAQQRTLEERFGIPAGISPQLAEAMALQQWQQSLAPAPQQPFTLGPGQQRFDPTGQLVAGVPTTVPPEAGFTLGLGQQRFDPTGQPIAGVPGAAPPGFTLGPGQQRFDPAGEPIAEVPAIEKPVLPTQRIAQKKLNEINRLQAKVDAGTITKLEQAKLDKMLVGAPLIEIGLGKPAAASERTAIAETRASLDAMNNLKTLFESSATETGPIVGRVSPVTGLAGLTTNEQEDLMAATSAFKNKVIKDITGAQMSEVEAKRIMKQIPDMTDPAARWRAKWRQTQKNLQTIQRRRTEVLRQSGLRVPEAQPEAQQQPQQQLQIGQTVINNGQQFRITGFDADGTPLGEPVR